MTTSGGRRDPDQIRSGLLAWCRDHRPDVVEAGIQELIHPKAGLSNETIIVVCHPTATDDPGRRLVVRLPPRSPSFPNQDFGRQARVQAAIAEAGIPTAAPIALESDERWLGVPFIVMPFVDGQIPGPASLYDPWLTDATRAQRRDSQREMVRVLAWINGVDWLGAGLEELLDGGRGRLVDQLSWWREYLRWASGEGTFPRIEAVLRWCEDHAPPDDAPPSLLWGDPRLENLVVGSDRRTVAVLDWDLATVGPPEMDLGWYLGLERALLELVDAEPLDGLAPRRAVIGDLEAAIGRPLQDMAWHEIFAVLRSVCINVRQAAISAEAGVRYPLPPGEANPLIPVLEGWIAEHRPPPG